MVRESPRNAPFDSSFLGSNRQWSDRVYKFSLNGHRARVGIRRAVTHIGAGTRAGEIGAAARRELPGLNIIAKCSAAITEPTHCLPNTWQPAVQIVNFFWQRLVRHVSRENYPRHILLPPKCTSHMPRRCFCNNVRYTTFLHPGGIHQNCPERV